ncbi:hypothetical protein PCANC_03625 [Puccinia coronata f. sp. avenae]|nr:hypothetical protein PCANC_07171 [Puccinia coronata f. sp. avenae]PLW53773.1 hypothetical protein PCANC_03625 [Puccinia coronata f. sp. avenae]
MHRSLFSFACCLAIIHSSLALPIILPRDGVTEAKPVSVQPKLCLLDCWDDDPAYWYDDPPPKHKPHDDGWYDDWDDDWDGDDDRYWDCLICLKGTEGPDGGPVGTPKHSVAKTVTEEASAVQGGSGSKESSVAKSSNEKYPVSPSSHQETSVPQSATQKSSIVENS